MGRVYQQTFIDTYTKVACAKLYDRNTSSRRRIYSTTVCRSVSISVLQRGGKLSGRFMDFWLSAISVGWRRGSPVRMELTLNPRVGSFKAR
jgi:hypothetical protein